MGSDATSKRERLRGMSIEMLLTIFLHCTCSKEPQPPV